jgi:hypothetical protein
LNSKGVPPGDYDLLVGVFIPAEHRCSFRRPLTVGLITLPSPAHIEGNVVIEGGARIDWSRVRLRMGSPGTNIRAAADGTFHVPIWPLFEMGTQEGPGIAGNRLWTWEHPPRSTLVLSPKVASVATVVHLDASDQPSARADVVLIPQRRIGVKTVVHTNSPPRTAAEDSASQYSSRLVSRLRMGETRLLCRRIHGSRFRSPHRARAESP